MSDTVHVVSEKLTIIDVEAPAKTVAEVMAEITEEVTTLVKGAAVPEVAAVPEALVEVKENRCRVCGKVIPPTGKRGRPAHVCAECKAAGKKA